MSLLTTAIPGDPTLGDQMGVIMSRRALGRAATALEKTQEARDVLCAALETAQRIGTTPFVPYILVGCADLLWGTGAREHAVAILVQILDDPACIRMARDEATALFKIAEAELPAEVLAAAQERGQAQLLQALMKPLLTPGAERLGSTRSAP